MLRYLADRISNYPIHCIMVKSHCEKWEYCDYNQFLDKFKKCHWTPCHWYDDKKRGSVEEKLRVGEHIPPARRGGLYAHPQKAQRCLGEDHVAKRERGGDDDGRGCVR